MTDIRFYHLQRSTLDKALAALLEKAQQKSLRCLVSCDDESSAKMLDESLWAAAGANFLPHSCGKEDSNKGNAPIHIAWEKDDNFACEVVFCCGIDENPDLAGINMYCKMIDPRVEEQLTKSRTLWKCLKDRGENLTYWQEGNQGGWTEKARSSS